MYAIFTMGLTGGKPALTAAPSVDLARPATLPLSGGSGGLGPAALALMGAGALLVAGGLLLGRRMATNRAGRQARPARPCPTPGNRSPRLC